MIKNVAIIMDGNGRWAKSKFRPRSWGHIKGALKINEIVEEAVKLNLDSLTLYAFSSENWSRPDSEIETLLKLLNKYLIRNEKLVVDNNIRFNVIGRLDSLSIESKTLIENLKNKTHLNSGLKLNFAFSYGARQELVDAFKKMQIAKDDEIDEEKISKYLYDSSTPEIDLMIRTGGDQRISNFLLWQCAYAELQFTKTKWPDFSAYELRDIINKVSKVDRRFGSLDNSGSLKKSKQSIKEKGIE